ncbi:MAG: hypothetical protein IT374_01910 [Polyangiaceae bacterium]|nr:hypothetical protein [Polyangiaceae bacterium]
MRRATVRRRATGLAASVLALSGAARADFPTFTITETSVLNLRFDNRDGDKLNDHYFEWLNRLNVQAASGRTTAAVRVDSAAYARRPDPNVLGRDDARAAAASGELLGETESEFARRRTITYGRQLSSRYVNTLYPSKAFLSHREGPAELTVGDFYAQLGKGLVLSMRKVDELGTDTTVRGAKAELRPDVGAGRKLSVLLLAGQSNPIRVDEVTGRRLTQAGSLAFVAAPAPNGTFYDPAPLPTFAPDTIYGGRVEGGTSRVLVGLMGAGVHRARLESNRGASTNPASNAGDLSVVGASLSLPNLADHGSAYVEVATQSLRSPIDGGDRQLSRASGGTGVYVQANAYSGPVTLTLEGKRYDRFFPLMANATDPAFAQLQYNAPPTTELITNDTQYDAFNTCVTGGRARLDLRGSEHALVYGSVGRYVTYGERSSRCGEDIDGNTGRRVGKGSSTRNDVWDSYVGVEVSLEENRTHAYVQSGLRMDDAAEAEQHDGTLPSTVYYREHWARWNFVKKVVGPWSVAASGVYRRRHRPLQTPQPWREVENYVSILYSPRYTLAFGYEATTVKGRREDFYNALFQVRLSTDKIVRLYVGQSRQGLRCVSGVCRIFPAYEGAKLEAVLRF